MYQTALKAYDSVNRSTMSGRDVEAEVLTKAALKLKDEDFDRLESVSVTQWCKDNGLFGNKTVFGMIHAVSTLITTINDPDDISIGDIVRAVMEDMRFTIRQLENYIRSGR